MNCQLESAQSYRAGVWDCIWLLEVWEWRPCSVEKKQLIQGLYRTCDCDEVFSIRPLTVFENVKHSKARKVVQKLKSTIKTQHLLYVHLFSKISEFLNFSSYGVVPFRGHKVMIRGWSNMSLCVQWQKLVKSN